MMDISYSIPRWIDEELAFLDLPDKRLERRAQIMLCDQYAHPEKTMFSSAHDEAAAKGAYRFQQNSKVNSDDLLNAHCHQALQRARSFSVVLGLHDTTELNFTGQLKKEETGTLHTEKSRGFLLHPVVLYSPEKLCLGTVHLNQWSRDPQEFGKSKHRQDRCIEEKESYRWLLSFRALTQVQQQLNKSQVVSVSDAESDIYELFLEALSHPDNPTLLLRAAYNRCLEKEVKKLWPFMESLKTFEVPIAIPRKGKQPARETTLQVSYAPVSLKAPEGKSGASVELYAVYAREVDPPEGVEALSWMLLSTRRIGKLKHALSLIEWYAVRWQIEIYFKTLKTSCRVLADQTQKSGHFEITLAFKLIVTWRIIYMTYLARERPEVSCQEAFEEAEWKALWTYVNQNPQTPDLPPSLKEATRMLAKLGGYKQWKKNQLPGPQTLAKGLLVLNAITEMWQIMNHQQPSEATMFC